MGGWQSERAESVLGVGGRESGVAKVKGGRVSMTKEGVMSKFEGWESHGVGPLGVQLPPGSRLDCVD